MCYATENMAHNVNTINEDTSEINTMVSNIIELVRKCEPYSVTLQQNQKPLDSQARSIEEFQKEISGGQHRITNL